VGTIGLPDKPIQCLRAAAQGQTVDISGRSQVSMLQLLCNTSVVHYLANVSIILAAYSDIVRYSVLVR